MTSNNYAIRDLNGGLIHIRTLIDDNQILLNLDEVFKSIYIKGSPILIDGDPDESLNYDWILDQMVPVEGDDLTKKELRQIILLTLALELDEDYLAFWYWTERHDYHVRTEHQDKIIELVEAYLVNSGDTRDIIDLIDLYEEKGDTAKKIQEMRSVACSGSNYAEMMRSDLLNEYGIKPESEEEDLTLLKEEVEHLQNELSIKKALLEMLPKATNNDEIQYKVAQAYKTLDDNHRYLYWLNYAANLGNVNACLELAHNFFEGKRIKEDRNAAGKWFRKGYDTEKKPDVHSIDYEREDAICRFYGYGGIEEKTGDVYRKAFPSIAEAAENYEQGKNEEALTLFNRGFEDLKKDPCGKYLRMFIDLMQKPVYMDGYTDNEASWAELKEKADECSRILSSLNN